MFPDVNVYNIAISLLQIMVLCSSTEGAFRAHGSPTAAFYCGNRQGQTGSGSVLLHIHSSQLKSLEKVRVPRLDATTLFFFSLSLSRITWICTAFNRRITANCQWVTNVTEVLPTVLLSFAPFPTHYQKKKTSPLGQQILAAVPFCLQNGKLQHFSSEGGLLIPPAGVLGELGWSIWKLSYCHCQVS